MAKKKGVDEIGENLKAVGTIFCLSDAGKKAFDMTSIKDKDLKRFSENTFTTRDLKKKK